MTVENLLQALELISDEDEPTERLRKRRKKRYRKAYREGRLHFDWTWANRLMAFKICVAEQILGRFHWVGWECRANEQWALATRDFHLPRWDGKPCKLLVIAEQGLGDEILFASCFPDLLKVCPQATIECDPRLLPVFRRSFAAEFISRRVSKVTSTVQGVMKDTRQKIWKDYEGLSKTYDAFVLAGELPKLYRHSKKDFPGEPYLKAAPTQKYDWIKYGISWEGRQGFIDPDDLMVHDGEYLNLQYGDKHLPLKAWTPDIDLTDDIDDVFSLVANLKAVYTVPNTLAHIGGSLGVKTHVVRPQAVYAGDREGDPLFHNRMRFEFGRFDGRTPWYKSVRTYRNVAEFKGRV